MQGSKRPRGALRQAQDAWFASQTLRLGEARGLKDFASCVKRGGDPTAGRASVVNCQYTFTGRYLDTPTGLHYFRYRYYEARAAP